MREHSRIIRLKATRRSNGRIAWRLGGASQSPQRLRMWSPVRLPVACSICRFPYMTSPMKVGDERITCFVSSTADDDRNAVMNAISEMGVAVRSDLDVVSGVSWAASLNEGLRQATFVCVVLGDRPVSAAVMYEAGVAVGMGRPLVVVGKLDADTSLAQLSDAPVIRYKSDDDTTLREGLRAYIDLLQQAVASPSATQKPVTTKSWSRLAPAQKKGSELERAVAASLETSGALVALDPAIGDAGVDMTASFPVLGAALNPVLIEVKTTIRGADNRALDQLRKAMRRHGARFGMLVTRDKRSLKRVVEGSTAILVVSVAELETLSAPRIEQELIRLRNELFHGASSE